MIPPCPLRRPLAKLLTFLFVASLAYSQAPPKYDRATETTFKTTVTELRFVPPEGAKTIAYVLTKTAADKEAVQIFLCPKKFLDDIGVTFKTDDTIEITGSKVKQDGADLILAREVVKGGETVTLRFQDGRPAW